MADRQNKQTLPLTKSLSHRLSSYLESLSRALLRRQAQLRRVSETADASKERDEETVLLHACDHAMTPHSRQCILQSTTCFSTVIVCGFSVFVGFLLLFLLCRVSCFSFLFTI